MDQLSISLLCDDIPPAKERSRRMHAKNGNTVCEAQVPASLAFAVLYARMSSDAFGICLSVQGVGGTVRLVPCSGICTCK